MRGKGAGRKRGWGHERCRQGVHARVPAAVSLPPLALPLGEGLACSDRTEGPVRSQAAVGQHSSTRAACSIVNFVAPVCSVHESNAIDTKCGGLLLI